MHIRKRTDFFIYHISHYHIRTKLFHFNFWSGVRGDMRRAYIIFWWSTFLTKILNNFTIYFHKMFLNTSPDVRASPFSPFLSRGSRVIDMAYNNFIPSYSIQILNCINQYLNYFFLYIIKAGLKLFFFCLLLLYKIILY